MNAIDYRKCTVCHQQVPMYPPGCRCTCEIAQANHMAAVRSHRMIDMPEIAPYRSIDEQGLPDSDTQDAPVAMPSYGLNWRNTLAIMAICLFLTLMFAHAVDGVTKWGRQINSANTGIKALDEVQAKH